MGRAAVPLDTIWPDGADPKTLVCVRVQCSAADLFNLLFVERDLSEQLHKQRADNDLAETSWMASKDQLPSQLYTWDAETNDNQPSTALRYRKVRFESPPTALASKPFQNEEMQVITELFPDTLYVVEAISSTSAPYGDKFNVFFRYVIRADGPATSALHLLFHVEFLPSMNRMMRPMVGKAIDAGVRGTFRIFRFVLGAARPCTDIKEGDLPAGPPAVYQEHVPETEEAAEGPEVARAHVVHHPPLAAPGPLGPGGPNLLSVLTQQLLYKDQVVLLADLLGAGLRSLTHSDAGTQLLAALLTVWLISLAVRALRGWQALCAPTPPGGAPAGGLVFLVRLGVCWPLRLVDVPESTAEVLASLALVAAINWAVIWAAQATVKYLSEANPALLASLRQGGGGGGGVGGAGAGASFGGVPFGQQELAAASLGQGGRASSGGAGGNRTAAAAAAGSASMAWAPSSASHVDSPGPGGGPGRGHGKDGSKRGSGGGGGGAPATAAPVSGAAAGTSARGKASAAATGASAKPSKPLRAAPAPKQFTAAQLKQLELGVVTSGKKSPKGAAGAAEALASGAPTSRAPSPPPPHKSTPMKATGAATREAPVHAMAAMTDAWAADLPAGLVSPSDTKRTAVSPQRGPSTSMSGTPLATPPSVEGSALGMAASGGGGDGAGLPSVAAAPHPTSASAAVPPAAASASASITTNSFANMFTKEGIDSMAESLRSAFRWDAKPTDASEQAESAFATPEPSASPSGPALPKSKARSDAGALTSAADAAGRPAGLRNHPAAGVSARSLGGVSGGVPYYGSAALTGGASLCSAQSDWPLLPLSDAEEEDGGEPSVVVEEVFENERFQPFRGWGHMWPGHFLPSDRVGHWSDRQGKPGSSASMVFEQVVPKLPPGWRWLDEWQVDLEGLDSEAVDPDGWTYALDFYLLKYPPPPQGGKCSLKHFVRRRRYYRTRILADEAGGDDQVDYGDGSSQPAEEPTGSVALKPLTGSSPPDQTMTLAQAADYAPNEPTGATLANGAAKEAGPSATAGAAAKGRDSGTATGGGNFTAPDAVLSLSEALAEQPSSAAEGAARPALSAAEGGLEESSVELRPPLGRADGGPGVEAGGEEGGASGLMSTGGAGGSSARCGAEGEDAALGSGGGGSKGEAFVLSPKTVMTRRDPLGALPKDCHSGPGRQVVGFRATAPEPAAAPEAAAAAATVGAPAGVSASGVSGGSGSRIGHGVEGLVAAALDGAALGRASDGEAPLSQGRGPTAVGGQVGEAPQVGVLGSGARTLVQLADADSGRAGAGGGGGLVSGDGEGGSAGSAASRRVSDDSGRVPAE